MKKSKRSIPSLAYHSSNGLKNLSNSDCLGIWQNNRFRDSISKILYKTGFGVAPYGTYSLFHVDRLREIEASISKTLNLTVRLTRSKAAALNWILKSLATPDDLIFVLEDVFMPAIEVCELNRIRCAELSRDNLQRFAEFVDSTSGLCILVYSEGTTLAEQVLLKTTQLQHPKIIFVSDISLTLLDYLDKKKFQTNHIYVWDFSLFGLDMCCAVSLPPFIRPDLGTTNEPPYASEFAAECVDCYLSYVSEIISKHHPIFTFKKILRDAQKKNATAFSSIRPFSQPFFALDAQWVEAVEFKSLEEFDRFQQTLLSKGYFVVPTQLPRKGEMIIAGLVFNNPESRDLANNPECLEIVINMITSIQRSRAYEV